MLLEMIACIEGTITELALVGLEFLMNHVNVGLETSSAGKGLSAVIAEVPLDDGRLLLMLLLLP